MLRHGVITARVRSTHDWIFEREVKAEFRGISTSTPKVESRDRAVVAIGVFMNVRSRGTRAEFSPTYSTYCLTLSVQLLALFVARIQGLVDLDGLDICKFETSRWSDT